MFSQMKEGLLWSKGASLPWRTPFARANSTRRSRHRLCRSPDIRTSMGKSLRYIRLFLRLPVPLAQANPIRNILSVDRLLHKHATLLTSRPCSLLSRVHFKGKNETAKIPHHKHPNNLRHIFLCFCTRRDRTLWKSNRNSCPSRLDPYDCCSASRHNSLWVYTDRQASDRIQDQKNKAEADENSDCYPDYSSFNRRD